MEKPPPSLRKLVPYINLGNQHKEKDPVVAYYLYFQAANETLAVSKTDASAKAYAVSLLNKLETMKGTLRGREEMSSDVVAQVHVENTAMKLFNYADNEDRNGRFHINMKKAFYASAFIFEALKVFGEVSDEVEEKRKYAKWKAVDIDKCLKNGITPTPGPPGGDNSEFLNLGMGSGPPGGMGSGPPPGGIWIGYPGGDLNQNLQPSGSDLNPSSSGYNPSSGGYNQDHGQPIPKPRSIPPSEPVSNSGLTPEQLERVTKLCKYAISSLDYEDKDGAIENLTKALNLLKTGRE